MYILRHYILETDEYDNVEEEPPLPVGERSQAENIPRREDYIPIPL